MGWNTKKVVFTVCKVRGNAETTLPEFQKNSRKIGYTQNAESVTRFGSVQKCMASKRNWNRKPVTGRGGRRRDDNTLILSPFWRLFDFYTIGGSGGNHWVWSLFSQWVGYRSWWGIGNCAPLNSSEMLAMLGVSARRLFWRLP